MDSDSSEQPSTSRPHRVRKKPVKKDEPSIDKRFTEQEIAALTRCLKRYGHLKYSKWKEYLPNRNKEAIQALISKTSHDARKNSRTHPVLDSWIDTCIQETTKLGVRKYKDTLQIAQVVKYLSIDGLLENHPLPERSNGIDFPAAYRLLYQALMGYPIQPVNKETADFVYSTITELNSQVNVDADTMNTVKTFLQQKSDTIKEETPSSSSTFVDGSKITINPVQPQPTIVKPVRVYQRKKPPPAQTSTNTEEPVLRLTIEDCGQSAGSGVRYAIKGSDSEIPHIITAPTTTPTSSKSKEEEEEKSKLFRSISYNPLQLPEKWLREPLTLKPIKMKQSETVTSLPLTSRIFD